MPIDLRTRKLAQLAVKTCVGVKPNQKVVISGGVESVPFIQELYKAVILAKAHPITQIRLPDVADFFFKYATKEQLTQFPQHTMDLAKQADHWIGIDTETNTKELNNSDSKKITLKQKINHPVSDYICNNRDKIHRVTIAYPVHALAQEAEMSLDEYEKFVYSACLQKWTKLKKFLNKLKTKFKEGTKIHLLGENVDLKLKVHGGKAAHDLETFENMPGGEVFMAPIKDSLEGWIKFEYPLTNTPKQIEDVFLRFEKGKVVEFDASKNKDLLKELLNLDGNSSYIGEFGIGANPKITQFTKNLLFDEKIGGTIHLALGMAYKENLPEGEKRDSAIHIDIVKDMKKAKILVDGKIIQEKGIWKI
jgi:aminopeptidase